MATELPRRNARRPRVVAALITIGACLAFAQCGGKQSPAQPTRPPTGTAPPGTTPIPPPVPPSAPQIFVGAGDIGWCGSPGPEQTARLVDSIGGTVFTAGDNAYFFGTAQEFRDCYDPSWGRLKSRTRPVPGNHEYAGAGPGPYFDYFGASAGPSGLGYYSFELGDWHAIALNSNIDVGAASGQMAWLRADLAASSKKCSLAYWHHPLFTSGPNGSQTYMRDVWRVLYDSGVDVIINGHEHLYERFAPQDPDGRPDQPRGIREFIVGTGGASLYNFVTRSPNSEQQISNTFGVLKLTLSSGQYQWDFIPVSGAGDTGIGSCH
jgi:hypothetical protein